MASKNSTALKIVAKTSKSKAVKTPESIREAIIQEVLDAMHLGDLSDHPPTTSVSGREHEDFLINNHFAYCSSQLNADLAAAAHCELEGDFELRVDDDDALDFYNSSEYEKAKQTFLDDVQERLRARAPNEKRAPTVDDPLGNFARRMRYSGLLSPERMTPDSEYVRRERRNLRRRQQEQFKQYQQRTAAK
jgi:hypothetical protein